MKKNGGITNMVTLVCTGCGRIADVDTVYGDEKCKECDQPMADVEGKENLEETNKFQIPDALNTF